MCGGAGGVPHEQALQEAMHCCGAGIGRSIKDGPGSAFRRDERTSDRHWQCWKIAGTRRSRNRAEAIEGQASEFFADLTTGLSAGQSRVSHCRALTSALFRKRVERACCAATSLAAVVKRRVALLPPRPRKSRPRGSAIAPWFEVIEVCNALVRSRPKQSRSAPTCPTAPGGTDLQGPGAGFLTASRTPSGSLPWGYGTGCGFIFRRQIDSVGVGTHGRSDR